MLVIFTKRHPVAYRHQIKTKNLISIDIENYRRFDFKNIQKIGWQLKYNNSYRREIEYQYPKVVFYPSSCSSVSSRGFQRESGDASFVEAFAHIASDTIMSKWQSARYYLYLYHLQIFHCDIIGKYKKSNARRVQLLL